ncbi:enoyl-CoA hydratase family protein [Nocardioides marmoribigeumensis]|uniref:Enoyl-CoA hydratase/methylglutaconyl-CoA hydratase n=1 Tax=Nocardioides marmoribigeumensis TaxID=433649 RepID=A0ABU2BWR3_9ACTN|nr:enoyl-CoA hydratase family protein [Nocardioides marmoribigeumensis]MDR7362744.1 enoyl-CoA hydratase/methylglutaconyl-CoA hydratase [Nocardioides marmoribigeumensis]
MTDASAEPVHYDVADQVATLTLDQPHNRNALSKALVRGLFDGLTRAEEDDEVKVVLLRSADRVFCSGADLSEATGEGMVEGAKQIVELQRRVVASPKPVVVRLDGPVRAGGIGIVAAADVAVAGPDASFALTEVRLGLAAAVISLTVFHRMTSRAGSRAILTGETFDARQAAEWGLVTEAADDVDAAVGRVLDDLRKGHPQGLRESKRVVNGVLLQRIEDHGTEMAELSGRLFGSDAAREAMLAFLSRKKG